MASMQIEVAASSSPFSYVSLKDHKRSANIMGYINSQCVHKNKANDKDQDEDSSWLPSQNSKTTDSWLPTISHNSMVTLESKGSCYQKVENNVDDSWLPTISDNHGKYGTDANESENDIDYSWLPSTFVDNVKNKEKSDNINKNTTKTKKNSNNSNNKSNSNNNNNSCSQKQSRNDHWALARKVVFSDQQNQNAVNLKKTTDTSCSRQQDSPSKSRYVVESPNSGGVSSLLQRWTDLAKDKNSNNAKDSPSNNNDSVPTCKDNKTDNGSPSSPTNSDVNLETHKESLLRQFSCPLPSRDSKEKTRVVDIIKKLSSEELAASNAVGHGNQLLAQIQTNLHPKQIEDQKGIKGVKISRHLIRGRQAFDTFLMQMEKDKHRELKWFVERKAVSNFKHRGRIQSLLRFKLMRLGAEPKLEDKIYNSRISKPLESNKQQDIRNIRERFNSTIEKGVETRKDKRNDQKNIASVGSQAAISTTTKEVEIKTKTTTNNKKQERQPKSGPMVPDQSTHVSTTSFEVATNKAKFVDSYSSPTKSKEDDHYKDNNNDDDNDNDNNDDFYDDEGQFMSAKTSYDQMENRNRRMQALESFNDWMTIENSQTHSELDEYESSDMQLFDTNDDWISHISRPKSDWEDMRQARYEEMLEDQSLANGDIQRLLERKNVSSFLGSSLRDLIDQLMTSRVQQSQAQIEKQDLVVRKKEEYRKEFEVEDGLVVAEDRRSITETKCSKYNEYADQISYSERSWRPKDVVCKSETTTTTSPSDTTTTTSPSETMTTASPFIEQPFSFNRSHNNSIPRSSPAITHQTIDMELIYEMRGHMEQLHHEIMDLRKSIKSCVNMQVKLQHSFKQNVGAAATHSVADQRNDRKPSGIAQHNCSICYDAQVDSLLYRCGHMCTCFNCAMELKRTSEECPVCEAPILDVVKAMCS